MNNNTNGLPLPRGDTTFDNETVAHDYRIDPTSHPVDEINQSLAQDLTRSPVDDKTRVEQFRVAGP